MNWTALITPFYEDGSLDLTSLKQLLKQQESAGNGILLLGSTGEGLALTDQEKQEVVEHACNLQVTVPLMVGVGGFQLPQVLNWIDFCNSLPIDSLLLVTPIYARPGPQGQISWFRSLLDRAKKRCMLYNIPHRAGCALSPEATAALSAHPNFFAIKEGSGSTEALLAYREAAPNIELFSGSDTNLFAQIQAGACGLVSVMGNCWPKATGQWVRQAATQASEPKLFKEAALAINRYNPISAKVLLHAKGWIQSAKVRPPLDTSEITSAADLIHFDQLVEKALASRVADIPCPQQF